MLLQTNQLIIEHFKNSDIPDWAKIESDADVRRFVDGTVLSFKEAGEYVEMNIRQYQRIGYGRYAVRLKETGNLIGMCGFLKENYGIDFGYRYTPSVWRNGFGFDVAKLVLNYGIASLYYHECFNKEQIKIDDPCVFDLYTVGNYFPVLPVDARNPMDNPYLILPIEKSKLKGLEVKIFLPV